MQKEFSHPAAVSILSASGEGPTRLDLLFRALTDRFGRVSAEAWSWRTAVASLVLAGVITAAGVWIEPVINKIDLAVLYLLCVVFSAVRWDRWAAIVSAVSGTVLFVYFFLPSRHSLMIGEGWYLITPVGLLTVGLTISILSVAAKEEVRAAKRREQHTAVLYSLTKSLASEIELDQIIDTIVHHLVETFQRPIAVMLPESGSLKVYFVSPGLVLDDREKGVAARVFESGEEGGCGAAQFSDSKIRYRPLKTGQGVVGVLGILASSTRELLPRNQQELLGTFMNQAALAITRADLEKKARRAELLQETDKLQKALLNSVSHDLRTPLVSVIGGLNSVLQDAALLDASTQRALLQTARDEAVRLNRLIQNLLDMTRLQGGAILAKMEPYDVHDVVGAALEQLGEAARNHPISVTIEPNLPLVPMDHALIVQVLVNLLDNALKYSPGDAVIEIGARLDHELQVRIANRGKEIPEQDLERVFDKFFRSATAGGARGVGLGLSICKGFVEAHHGRIWAERRLHGGTAMVFSLPLRGNQ